MKKVQKLKIHQDQRGKLIEIFKIPGCGQVYLVTAYPGVVRGNHFHKRKTEKFCVIEGKARLNLRNQETNKKKTYRLTGEKPEVVSVPTNHVHNIVNVGDSQMVFLSWVDEIFDPKNPDTFAEEV